MSLCCTQSYKENALIRCTLIGCSRPEAWQGNTRGTWCFEHCFRLLQCWVCDCLCSAQAMPRRVKKKLWLLFTSIRILAPEKKWKNLRGKAFYTYHPVLLTYCRVKGRIYTYRSVQVTFRRNKVEQVTWVCTNNPTGYFCSVTEELYRHVKLADYF